MAKHYQTCLQLRMKLKKILAAQTTRVKRDKLFWLYAIIVPLLTVVDFVLKGKVPVVCHSFLSTWEEVYRWCVGFYGVRITTVVFMSKQYCMTALSFSQMYCIFFYLFWFWAGDCSVLQGKKVLMYALRGLSMCLSHFRRKGRFIKVFHQSKKKCFFAVTATNLWVNNLFQKSFLWVLI